MSLALPSGAQKYVQKFERFGAHLAKMKEKAEMAAGRAKDGLLITAGGAAAGAALGTFANASGHIPTPGLPALPLDAAIPALGILAGTADAFGEYSDDAVLFFAGALAVSVGKMTERQVRARVGTRFVVSGDLVGYDYSDLVNQ